MRGSLRGEVQKLREIWRKIMEIYSRAKVADIDKNSASALKMFKIINKETNEISYEIPALPSVLNLGELVDEMLHMIKFYKPQSILQYITYKYGLLPNMYSSYKIMKNPSAPSIVLNLINIKRKRGTRLCEYIATNYGSLEGMELNSGKKYPGRLKSLKFRKKHDNEILFNKYCFKGKTILSESQFLDSGSYVLEHADTSYRDFIFKPQRICLYNKNSEEKKKLKPFYINPEVAMVLQSFKPMISLIGNKDTKTFNKQDYKNPDSVFVEMLGVVPFKLAERAISSEMTLKNGGYSRSIDPSGIKTYIVNPHMPELMIIPDHTKAMVEQAGLLPDFKSYDSIFYKYKESIKGTARELLVRETDSYPDAIWKQYFLHIESENPGVENKTTSSLRKLFSLDLITIHQEIEILKYRHTVQMTSEFGLLTNKKSNTFNQALFETSQVIFSLIWGKEFKNPKGYKDSALLSVFRSDAKLDEVYTGRFVKFILWNKVKTLFDKSLPFLFSTLHNRGLTIVAKHHDQFNPDAGYCGCEESIAYTVWDKEQAHNLNTTAFSTVALKRLGHYNSANRLAVNTESYNQWFRNYCKSKFPITNELFIKNKAKFEIDVNTKKDNNKQLYRISEVSFYKKLYKKRIEIYKKLDVIFKDNKEQVTRRVKAQKILKYIEKSNNKLRDKIKSPSDLKLEQKRISQKQLEVMAIKRITDVIKNSMVQPHIGKKFSNGDMVLESYHIKDYDEEVINEEFGTAFRHLNLGTNRGFSSKIIKQQKSEINTERAERALPLLKKDEEDLIIKKVVNMSIERFSDAFVSFIDNVLLFNADAKTIVEKLIDPLESEYFEKKIVTGRDENGRDIVETRLEVQDPEVCRKMNFIKMFKDPKEYGSVYKRIAGGNLSEVNLIISDILFLFNSQVTLEDFETFNTKLNSITEIWRSKKERKPTINNLKELFTQYEGKAPKKELVVWGITEEKYKEVYDKYITSRENHNLRMKKYYAKRKRK
jgi:hypothetical protein